jgi:glycosyltransferase involved in cell wall biosynthesis
MNNALNIAILSDVFPPKCGGSGWSSFYLARALQQRGHNVQVVVPKEGKTFSTNSRKYESLPVTEFIYPSVKIPFARNFTRNERLYPRFAEWLEGFFKQHKIQVAHGQHYLTIPPAIIAAQKSGAVSLATIRDYWAVCYWTTHLSGNKLCPGCSPINRLKCLYRNQGAFGVTAAPVSLYMASNLRLKQKWLAQADAVLGVSHYVASKLAPFVPPERLRVLPTFVDLDQLQEICGQKASLKISEPYLLYMGKLEENKGAGMLLDVLRTARPTIPTLVAGEGSMRASLEETATREGLNIKFLGWVEHDEALKLLAKSEALLFTSLWHEPLSRVLLEAIGLGALVVGINTGGTPDAIEDGLSGALAATPTEMGEKLKELLKPENAGKRMQMRSAALQVARERFSQPVVIARTEQLYYELLAQKRTER